MSSFRSASTATTHLLASVILGLCFVSPPARAQPDANGYEWATITHPSNPAYSGFDPFGYVTGRGSVAYEYRLARTEVSTAQWLEFFNTFMGTATPPPHMSTPRHWSAGLDPNYQGPGVQYRLSGLANAGQTAGYGVTWRTAAMYCNWLHNNKSSDPAAVMTGAYDVSTFFDNPDGTFTDQATHSPGARYWIPTLDEWLKAAHWDPNHSDNGGWWTYSNGSDIPLTYGPPPSFGGDGTGQANAVFRLPNFAHYDIPLGSYPDTPSIWGLLDIAGSGSEWTETIRTVNGRMYRRFDGSSAGGSAGGDVVYGGGDQSPWSISGDFSLRLASSVASPSVCGILGLSLCVLRGCTRQRRSHEAHRQDCNRGVRGGGRVSFSMTLRMHRRSSSRRARSGVKRIVGRTSRRH
ncbi:MAG: SUMF1/EgtB/PvdO family nonheme iron enzyme [Phycisphaerales bacterium]